MSATTTLQEDLSPTTEADLIAIRLIELKGSFDKRTKDYKDAEAALAIVNKIRRRQNGV